jgi:hypothetical protein
VFFEPSNAQPKEANAGIAEQLGEVKKTQSSTSTRMASS